MSDAVISLLIQVPLVGAFIVFTLLLTKQFQSEAKSRQDEMMAFVDSQNSRWRDALSEERARRKEAMDTGMQEVDRLARSIEQLATAVADNSRAMMAHDVAARERHQSLERRIEAVAK